MTKGTQETRGRVNPTPPPPFPGSGVSTVEYAYPWNAPRPAIGAPFELCGNERHQHEKMIVAVAAAMDVLARQPAFIRRDIDRQLNNLEEKKGQLHANMFLTKDFVERILPRLDLVHNQYRLSELSAADYKRLRAPGQNRDPALTADAQQISLMRRFNHLPDMGRADTELLARDITDFIKSELSVVDQDMAGAGDLKVTHTLYRRAGKITRQFRQSAPLWEKLNKRYFNEDDALPAIARMISETWWLNRLRRTAAEWKEHLQIALSNVSKKVTPYASRGAVADWREQKRRTREFLKGMELEDEAGNRISLIEKYDGSVANPPIRRGELMTRISGFEKICNQMGYIGEFYTMTAPSKYHATTKQGRRNHKWNGASPAKTQRYLCAVWARIRAKLHREEIRIFGIRVAEPHHDATPHWHMLMFMHPDHVDRVREVIRDYVTDEDSHELKSERATKARFCAEAIDPEKGSATGYIAKYISKNIDGYALDDEIDDDTGKLLKEVAPAVSAWAARWRIRQFQFIGGAPVTVYRELRKMADHETAMGLSVEFAAVHDAADYGQWAEYVNAQGGAFVKRDDLVVRNWYETSEDLSPYGEPVTRIRGVFSPAVGHDVPIITRVIQWKIVPRRAVELAVDVKGAPAPSRSSVNNCTVSPIEIGDIEKLSRKEQRKLLTRLRQQNAQQNADKRVRRKKTQTPTSMPPGTEDIREALRIIGLAEQGGAIEILTRRSSISFGPGQSLRLRNGTELEIVNNKQYCRECCKELTLGDIENGDPGHCRIHSKHRSATPDVTRLISRLKRAVNQGKA